MHCEASFSMFLSSSTGRVGEPRTIVQTHVASIADSSELSLLAPVKCPTRLFVAVFSTHVPVTTLQFVVQIFFKWLIITSNFSYPNTYRKRQQRPDRVWTASKCWPSWDGRQLPEPKRAQREGAKRAIGVRPLQPSGEKRAREQQRQEETQPHDFHQLPARRAGESFSKDALPWRLCSRATGAEDGPDRGSRSGEKKTK